MDKIQIIGICGHKFNGKDTIADYLVKNYGFTKLSFGDNLKFAMRHIFGFDDEQLWGTKKEIIDPFWNVSPREMMQYFGTECCRIKLGSDYKNIGNNLWVMSLQKNLNNLIEKNITKIVIPDVRFENELSVINHYNGLLLRVIRPSIIPCDTHLSENSLNSVMENYTFINNSLEQLYRDVDIFVQKYIVI